MLAPHDLVEPALPGHRVDHHRAPLGPLQPNPRWRGSAILCARSTSYPGCFFLITRSLWQRLGGFDPLFFMYGEEADLCLRAKRLGARPVLAPQATIIHYGGASETKRASKMMKLRRQGVDRSAPFSSPRAPSWLDATRSMAAVAGRRVEDCRTRYTQRPGFKERAGVGRDLAPARRVAPGLEIRNRRRCRF